MPTSVTLGTEMVTVLVGEYLAPHPVHKTLIVAHSEYFARAFSGDFKEANNGSVELRSVSETTFKLFTQWLYGQALRPINVTPCDEVIPLPKSLMRNDNKAIKARTGKAVGFLKNSGLIADKAGAAYFRVTACLLDLYLLADAYETRSLRNDVMTMFLLLDAESNFVPPWADVAKVFDNLPESSSLCRYIVHLMALYWDPRNTKGDQPDSSLPPDFLFQMMTIGARRQWDKEALQQELEKGLREVCFFHEHLDEDEEQMCKSRCDEDTPFIHSLLLTCMVASG